MHRVNAHFCRHVVQRPLLLHRVVEVLEEKAKPAGSSGGSLVDHIEVSAHEIEQHSFDNQR
jgi:hypothetical protein